MAARSTRSLRGNDQNRGVRASSLHLLVLATIAASASIAGCGGGSTSAEQAQQDFGVNLGAPIQLADCTDWTNGNVPERLGTIRQIKNFAGGPTGSPEGRGATLPDDYAYDLFARFCSHEYARGFKLYKLYTRAAAFGAP